MVVRFNCLVPNKPSLINELLCHLKVFKFSKKQKKKQSKVNRFD